MTAIRCVSLADTTRALEVGNWPVLSERILASVVGGSGQHAHLAVSQSAVRGAMYAVAEGDVDRAWRLLGDAAALLPRSLNRCSPSGTRRRLAVLAPPPPRGSDAACWTWSTACVVWREQQQLSHLRAQFLPGRSTARDALVAAYIEYLRCVDRDPFLYIEGADVRAVAFDDRGAAMCRRASRIRRFGDPHSPDVDESVWRAIGRKPGLRTAALRRLAAIPLVPWTAEGVPVRRGWVATHRMARQWLDDTRY